MRCLCLSGVILVLLASLAQAQTRGSNRMSFFQRGVTANTATIPAATSNGAQARPALKLQPMQGTTFSKQWTAPLQGTASKPVGGQESFQRPPLVLGKMLPIQPPAKSSKTMPVKSITGVLLPAQSGQKSGEESFQRPPLVISKMLPIRPPVNSNKTLLVKPITGMLLPSQSGKKSGEEPSQPPPLVLPSPPLADLIKKLPPATSKTAVPILPKVSAVISPAKPRPISSLKPVTAFKPVPIKSVSVSPNPVPRSGKDPTENGLRAKLKLEKDVENEQAKELSTILGGLESIAIVLGAGTGVDPQKLQDALDAAKNGDFTKLQDLINDPNTDPQLKDVLDAFLKTAQLLQDVPKDGPLDDQKLKDLGEALKKFPASPLADSLLKTFESVQDWNELAKKLDSLPDDSDALGADELTMAAEVIALVQQALAAVGYGYGYGLAPGYGYGYGDGYGLTASGYYPEPPVPAAPLAAAPVMLANPAENNVTMPFLLNSETTELPAGECFELPNDRAWEIKFDRGQGFGVAHYALVDGPYKFTHTEQGWELVQGE